MQMKDKNDNDLHAILTTSLQRHTVRSINNTFLQPITSLLNDLILLHKLCPVFHLL